VSAENYLELAAAIKNISEDSVREAFGILLDASAATSNSNPFLSADLMWALKALAGLKPDRPDWAAVCEKAKEIYEGM